jgi:DNA-binding MarR family transcriptional regulator
MPIKTTAHPNTVTLEALLDDGSDTKFRGMLHGLLSLTARFDAVRQNFGKVLGISGVQYTMLMSIYHLDEISPVFINSVADHLHLSGAFVTIETGRLVAMGILRKTKDTEDGRRVRLEITSATRKRLAELVIVQREVNDLMFANFGRRDFNGLAKGIDLLVESSDSALSLSRYISESAIGQMRVS